MNRVVVRNNRKSDLFPTHKHEFQVDYNFHVKYSPAPFVVSPARTLFIWTRDELCMRGGVCV